MPRRPLEALIQDLVYNIEVGSGLQIVRGIAYFFLVIAVVLVFTATQFFAFGESEAMEYAQLGRNLAETGTLTTQVIRPSTMRFLIENTGGTVTEDGQTRPVGGDPRMESHPDILHPPVYPVLLAGWFKLLRIDFAEVPQGGKYPPELAIVALSHIFAVATGLLVWLIGRLLFSPRVGFLAMTVYFLSDLVWRTSISGLNLTLAGFLVTAACYFALVAVSRQEAGASAVRWLIPYLAAAALCVLMVLTRYGTMVMIPALALYFWIGFPRRGGALAALLLVLCAVGVTPWLLRNVEVSGSPLGFVPESTFIDTRGFGEDSFERTLAPGLEDLTWVEKASMIQRKWFRNAEMLYPNRLMNLGDGFLLVCLFFTAFFHRFVRRNVQQFRWCILLAIGLFLGLAGYFTPESSRVMYVFWPLVILYGLAFYYYLLDRLNLPLAVQHMAITTLLVLLCAAPLILNLMRRDSYPYPPYLRPYVSYVSNLLEPSELMCTDMPWATAWYGNRDSLLLPQTIDEFYEIHDLVREVSALYFTTLTRNRPFIRGLVLGKERSWFPLQQMQTPANFPLQHGTFLLQGDQLLITDRDRSADRTRRRNTEGAQPAAPPVDAGPPPVIETPSLGEPNPVIGGE